ncbi:MAG: hypothetical protein KF788_07610 [Piscinibacter sp.]|nr:hypothetical protein [Piscinibacter sp.]
MEGRYLSRIDATIAAASSNVERLQLIARKASYLARIGKFSEAWKLAENLRNSKERYAFPEISVSLAILDGVSAVYQDHAEEARDRLARASVLAKALGLSDLLALSSVWLAHLAFGRLDVGCMGTELKSALLHAGQDDHDCLTRASLVVAVAVHLAGDTSGAAKWYERARSHALSIGDEATISSLMYNRTAMQIANFRQQALQNGVPSGDARVVVSAAESTESFDSLVGVVSLGEFTPLLKAQTYSLAGRFSDADDIYDYALGASLSNAQERSRCWLLADWASCQVHIGRRDLAAATAMEAMKYLSPSVQPDDLAAAHGRLAQVFELLGDGLSARVQVEQSVDKWREFSVIQRAILEQGVEVEGVYLECVGRNSE